MVKLITKKFSLGKFTTFSSREIKDELLMYFIKKNFKSYNELDLEEIIASKKYQNFIKKYKSIYDCKKVTIYDEKTGALVHGTGDKKNINFIKKSNGFVVVLGSFKGGALHSSSKDTKNYTILSPENFCYISDLNILNNMIDNNIILLNEIIKTSSVTTKTQICVGKKCHSIAKLITKNPNPNSRRITQIPIRIGGGDQLCIIDEPKKSIVQKLIAYMQGNLASDMNHDFGNIDAQLFEKLSKLSTPQSESSILRNAVLTNCDASYKILLFNENNDTTSTSSLLSIPSNTGKDYTLTKKIYIEDTAVLSENSKNKLGDLFPNLASIYDPSSCGIGKDIKNNIDKQNELFKCLFNELIKPFLPIFNVDSCTLEYNTTFFKLSITIKNLETLYLEFPGQTFSINTVKNLIDKIHEIYASKKPRTVNGGDDKKRKQDNHHNEQIVYEKILIDYITRHPSTKVTFYFILTFLKFIGDQLQVLFALIYDAYFISIDRIAVASAITVKLSTFTKYPEGTSTDSIRSILSTSASFEESSCKLTSTNKQRILFHDIGNIIQWCTELQKYMPDNKYTEQSTCQKIYEIYTLKIPKYTSYEITAKRIPKSIIDNILIDDTSIDDTSITLKITQNILEKGTITKYVIVYSKTYINNYIESLIKLLIKITNDVSTIKDIDIDTDSNNSILIINTYKTKVTELFTNVKQVMEMYTKLKDKLHTLYTNIVTQLFSDTTRKTNAHEELQNQGIKIDKMTALLKEPIDPKYNTFITQVNTIDLTQFISNLDINTFLNNLNNYRIQSNPS